MPALYVWRRAGLTLRQDAQRITDFNIYLVRAGFFAVLFVGLADMAISFPAFTVTCIAR